MRVVTAPRPRVTLALAHFPAYPTAYPFASIPRGQVRKLRRVAGLSWCSFPKSAVAIDKIWPIFKHAVGRSPAFSGRLAAEAPAVAPWVGAAALLAAGLYQLTPLKDRCLSNCRSPLSFLLHFGTYSGSLRDLRVGLYHGGYCLGCCWGLMVVMIAVGVMNLAWMAGLAAIIFIEKTWRYGKELGIAFGIALVVLAFFVPWYPSLLPALHLDGGMGMQIGR